MKFSDLKLSVPKDCGNAPKKIILKDFNIAFVTLDKTFLLENISDDMKWIIVGNEIVEGKEEFINKLATLHKDKITELLIYNIITHGNVASVHGKVIGIHQSYDFCHVYKFTGASKTAKIKEITSFIIIGKE
ncbi:nuclear transport factor 2 family protein [Calidifontibacillus erzurumensis]|uniref:Nuclear transport factor 2 family protein n=1 Tax=Calidifontibacillus erzurumensis TaxID=2741433 RepID=A0A8J8KF35_9BACI|nr:nuclear transport factor 2 family protein [Calidifontibacillus erzurumensis]NSL52480.1 nuclear transport factor 2 family protein [Calidifontibacillus erzurumensis]